MSYLPYERLSIEWSSPSTLAVSLPWVFLTIEIEEENKSWITEAIEKQRSHPLHPSVQKFLEKLKDYPLWYQKARSWEELHSLSVTEKKRTFSMPLSWDLSTPLTLIHSLNPLLENSPPFPFPKNWDWSLEESLKAARVEGENQLYDPLTIVTYLIGKRLETENISGHERNHLHECLDALRQQDENLFFEVMGLLIRQTHYVTSRFDECSFPALEKFPQAEEVIQEFRREEQGHDRFMSASLKELDYPDPTVLSPLETTRLVMDLFKYASQTSPLAFTLMIGYFEGISIAEREPLADVLEKSTKPRSARGYALHHKVNKDGQHAQVIFDLAHHLPLLTEEEIIYSMRILELACHAGVLSDQYFYRLSQPTLF